VAFGVGLADELLNGFEVRRWRPGLGHASRLSQRPYFAGAAISCR
jgi:hypothetical protein